MNNLSEKLFYRGLEIRAQVDTKGRSVDVAFSSEEPVPRWFGREILLHGEDNVDLDQLKSMGATLMNHNPNVIVGPVRDVRIEDKRGKATLFFDDDEDGERAMRKVRSQSLRGVSVGYLIDKAVEVNDGDEYEGVNGPALIATRWVPYEISLTPIPADASVGVGRNATRSLNDIEITRRTSVPEGQADEESLRRMVRDILRETPLAELDGLRSSQGSRLNITAEEMRGLMGRAFAISPEAKLRVIDLVCEGRSAAEIGVEISRMAGQGSGADALFRGAGPGGDGIGLDAGKSPEGAATYRKVADVPSDVLIEMICNPNPFNFR